MESDALNSHGPQRMNPRHFNLTFLFAPTIIVSMAGKILVFPFLLQCFNVTNWRISSTNCLFP